MKNLNIPSSLCQGEMQKSILSSRQNPTKSPLISGTGRRAFTLVELIIVITILAILATIAFMSFQGYAKQSRDSNRLTTIKTIEKGVDLFLTKSGKIPAPDEADAFTGGSAENPVTISQGTVGAQMVQVINMNQVPLDPKTQAKYHYSVFGETPYYQIGIEQEQDSVSYISPSYADSEEVMISGNYTFDPSLPSLFVVEDSVVSGGLFGTGVCFVVNGGLNDFESTIEDCQRKLDMRMADYDKGLEGYWNFDETGYVPTEDLYGGTNFFKDYSGNGHYAFNSGSVQGTHFVAPIQTGGYMNNGLYFSSGGIIVGEVKDFNFESSITISAITNLYEFKNSYPRIVVNQDSFVFHYNNKPDLGHIHTLGGQIYNRSATGVMLEILSDEALRTKQYIPENMFLNNFLFVSLKFDKDTITHYINGKNMGSSKRSGFTFGKRLDGTFVDHAVSIGGIAKERSRDFKGIIDEVKIYNRALSDQEILQQAKIAGF